MLNIKGASVILDAESSKNLKRIIEKPDPVQANRRREFLKRILQQHRTPSIKNKKI